MTSTISHHTEHLINQAQSGDPQALGPLLSSYALQLRRIADRQLDDKLRGRVSSSDIVQETLFQATRDFSDFRGTSDAEFSSWLRRILARKLSKNVERHVLAEKRDVRREVFLGHSTTDGENSRVNLAVHHFVADQRPGPVSEVVGIERNQQIDQAMLNLPPPYREVVELRNVQGLSFDEIAKRSHGTSGAARMRWLRAIDMLRKQLNQRDSR